MKGTLKNKEGKWFVEYWYMRTSSHAIHPNQTELPLHPDSKIPYLPIGYENGVEVEFEIVAYGNPCKYHKNLLDCKNPPNCDCEFNYRAKLTSPKQGSFDEDGFGITRVIDDKQEDHFKKVKESITNSTKNSGYSVYIPESAKKSEQQETWQDILDEFAKYGKGKLGDWLIENFEVPKRK